MIAPDLGRWHQGAVATGHTATGLLGGRKIHREFIVVCLASFSRATNEGRARMTGGNEPEDHQTPQDRGGLGHDPEPPANQRQAGDAPGGDGTPGSPQTPPTPAPLEQDRWPLRLGILLLGLIALLCVGALIYLSQKPAPPGTTEAADAQATASQEGTTTGAAGPVAVQVAGETGTLGLLGQIVGVLATVAAAAVGGIAGFLTAARTGGAGATPAGNSGRGGANDS
jgi:hypothetical protein